MLNLCVFCVIQTDKFGNKVAYCQNSRNTPKIEAKIGYSYNYSTKQRCYIPKICKWYNENDQISCVHFKTD